MTDYLFDLPSDPQQVSVALEPASLRRLDFSALDFDTIRRAGVEYVKTYYSDEFNDFFASNGAIMFLELVSYIGNIASERADILNDESFLPTSRTRESVSQHLQLIGQSIARATPAVVDVTITIVTQSPTEIKIPAGLVFSGTGSDGKVLNYELFRSPQDFVSSIVIPPGKKGVVAYGIEGRFGDPMSVVSAGGPDQTIDIQGDDILGDPITVVIKTGLTETEWDRVDVIEKYRSQDEVYEVDFFDTYVRIRFGNDVNGKAPLAGQEIIVKYRRGGGIRGRISSNFINETRPMTPESPASAAVEVRFVNITPSSGGTDPEDIEAAKRRAPREFATHDSAVSGEDYAFLSATFSHPVYGAVAKSAAVLRSGIEANIDIVVEQIRSASSEEEAKQILLDNYVNRNIIELYVLAEGPNGPVAPSTGLKQGLITFFDEIDVLTDEVRIYDGKIKPVDVEATVIMSRNADAGTVKEAVLVAINDFFDISKFDMGQGMNLSNLYESIQSVSGVKSISIFSPKDNILSTGDKSSPTEVGVGFDELITLGNVDLKFYFERGAYKK